jgi:hypothetical protein
MTIQDREIAKELKRRLSEVVNLLDFLVFGLRAQREAMPMNILILMF